jgi:hypothetical protein
VRRQLGPGRQPACPLPSHRRVVPTWQPLFPAPTSDQVCATPGDLRLTTWARWSLSRRLLFRPFRRYGLTGRALPPKSVETAATNLWILIHLGHMTCRLPVTWRPSCISAKKEKGLYLRSERREREISRRPNSPYRRHHFCVASSRCSAGLVGRCSRPGLVGLCTGIGEFLTGATQSLRTRSSPHAVIAT